MSFSFDINGPLARSLNSFIEGSKILTTLYKKHDQKYREGSIIAANAISILVKANVSFAKRDLSGTVLCGANLNSAILEFANLKGANLSRVNLSNANMLY